MPKDLPSPEMLRKLLDYNPATGALTWRPRTQDMFEDGKHSAERICARWNTTYVGTPAFAVGNNKGYLRGSIFGAQFKTSRVIWAISTGAWPSGQIDHINGMRDDNRIANLRDVTSAENQKNLSLSKRNASGTLGVQFYKPKGKWRARINADGKETCLGHFTDKADAIAARQAAETKFGYHENHGRKNHD